MSSLCAPVHIPHMHRNSMFPRQQGEAPRAGREHVLSVMRRSKGMAAVFIAANALTAGSIFCFPLFGPKMSADLGLSLTQTNAIWSAAIVGQYASAALFGHIADTYGPRPLSLLASVLFGAGYILMARTESSAIAHRHAEGQFASSQRANFIAMAAYFVLVGTGVAASLFSALRSSTSHFKSHPGLALSVPLTLFSLSSLFLSAFASLSYFTDPNTGDLNSPRWLAWLGAALMVTNALSALGLSVPSAESGSTSVAHGDEHAEARHASEASPLLGARRQTALVYSVPFGQRPEDFTIEPSLTLKEYLSVPSVWIMAVILFAAVGGSEMVMSSIGSMVVSLRATHTMIAGDSEDDKTRLGKETLALRTQQVQLLAIANTIARLLVGFVSDLLSPLPSGKRASALGTQSAWRRRIQGITVSRLSLLLFGLVLLLFTFIYSALFLDRVDRLWLVSLATGTGYGLTFTLLPSIIICVWPAQFGRNYGLLTYAAALGSLCFSMLFAQINDDVAARHQHSLDPAWSFAFPPHSHLTLARSAADDPTSAASSAICMYGRACFAPSFGLASLAVGVALGATIPLWRAWKTLL